MEFILKPKLAVIGAGRIARSHIDASLAAGFEVTAICGGENSQRAQQIASEYKTLEYFQNYKMLIESKFDALSIIASTQPTWGILMDAQKKDVPILIEKPVTTSLTNFDNHLIENKRLFVAYNRRFYSSINQLRKKLQANEFFLARLNISELSWDPVATLEKQQESVLENSVHSLDLVNYLFGVCRIVSVNKNMNTESLHSILVLLKNQEEKLIEVVISFGIPVNTSIEVWFSDHTVVCKPIEDFSEFINMKMIQPDEQITYKRYIPEKLENWKISINDSNFKPGFLEQYKEFLSVVMGDKSRNLATLMDARKVIEMATRIIKNNDNNKNS
jgi:predicted dehydrogenase